MSTRGHRKLAVILLFCLAAWIVSAMMCGPLSVIFGSGPDEEELAQQREEQQHAAEQVDQMGMANIETEQALLRVRLSLTQTALSDILTARAAASETAAPGPHVSNAHVPVILGVTFPSSIPANGTHAPGTIRFADAGRDVNQVSIQTLQGNFPSGSWEPGDSITWSGDTGTIPFEASCEGASYVLARITLQDAAGTTSAPVDISFNCV